MEIENSLPNVKFTAYTAVKQRFKRVPADYSEVYAYASKQVLKEIVRRFPAKQGLKNLIVLRLDEHLSKFKLLPLAQIFVDLWNINTWYAREFVRFVEDEIDGILERLGYR